MESAQGEAAKGAGGHTMFVHKNPRFCPCSQSITSIFIDHIFPNQPPVQDFSQTCRPKSSQLKSGARAVPTLPRLL
jgi:hypothetical protein